MTIRALPILLLSLLAIRPAFGQPAPGGPQTTTDASQGGVTFSSGVNSLRIGARAQVRWTLDARDEFDADTSGIGDGREDGPLSQFDVPRLRIALSGGVYRPWLRYAFQFEVNRTSGEGASKLKDATLEIRPVGQRFRILGGQFKVPFGLQQLTSSGRQQFVDRAITDAKFNPGRDMGVMLSGTLGAASVGYDVGIFNGSGESVRQKSRAHLWAGRLYVTPLGAYALSETAVDATDRPVLHLGAGVRGGDPIRGRGTPGVVEAADGQTAYNVELAFKAPRVYSTAEHFWMRDEQQNPIVAPDVDSRGWHAQAGVMLLARQVDIGIRYSRIDGDTSVADGELTELRGVFGYFWEAHNLKFQADVGRIGYGANVGSLSPRAQQGLPSLGPRLVTGRELSDVQVRGQLQLTF